MAYCPVGQSGTGTLIIENGGILTTTIPGADIGNSAGSQGAVTVTGAGSSSTNSGLLSVGTNGTGALTIANGGVVSNTNGFIGFATGSQGAVTVTGAGSTGSILATSSLVAYDSGALTIANGGSVNVGGGAGTVFVANQAGSTGTLNIGAAPSDPAAAPGTLNARNGFVGRRHRQPELQPYGDQSCVRANDFRLRRGQCIRRLDGSQRK